MIDQRWVSEALDRRDRNSSFLEVLVAKHRGLNDPKPVKHGIKHDAGKSRPSLVIEGFPRALVAVSEVATFGAGKYSPGGWQHVENGVERYTDAMYRHLLATDETDAESGLSHAAHAAWNALARLELMLREQEKEK